MNSTEILLAARREARAQKADRDRRLLALHVTAANILASGDQVAHRRALEQVAKWQDRALCSLKYINAWKRILAMPPEQMREEMLRDDANGVALRQNTPFGFMGAPI